MRDDRSIRDFLHDMLDAAQQAQQFVAGVDFARFQADREKIFAVIRALEIIGEAAPTFPGQYGPGTPRSRGPTSLPCATR